MFACSLLAAALTAVPISDGWRVERAEGTVLLEQHAAKDQRAYIHPLMAPDGKGVYTENEPKHHPWQHGLYVGLHAVNGINFWEKEQNKFHPEPVARGRAARHRAEPLHTRSVATSQGRKARQPLPRDGTVNDMAIWRGVWYNSPR